MSRSLSMRGVWSQQGEVPGVVGQCVFQLLVSLLVRRVHDLRAYDAAHPWYIPGLGELFPIPKTNKASLLSRAMFWVRQTIRFGTT